MSRQQIITADVADSMISAPKMAAGAAAANVGTLGGALTGTLPNPGLNAASLGAGVLGSDLYGTVSDGHVGVRNNSGIYAYDTGGVSHLWMCVLSDNVVRFYNAGNTYFLWLNQPGNVQLAVLGGTGDLSLPNGSLTARTGVATTAGTISASDGANGVFSSGAGSAYYRGFNGNCVMDGSGGLNIAVGPLNVGGSATVGSSITAAVVVSASGGFISNANGAGIIFLDANSRIFSASRITYFDEYNGGWYWRNTGAGAATIMSLTATGRLTINENYYTASGRLFSTNGGFFAIHAPLVYCRNVADSAWIDVTCNNVVANGGSVSLGGGVSIVWNGTYLNHSHSIQYNTNGNQIVWPNGSYISGNAGYVQGSREAIKSDIQPWSDKDILARVVDPRMQVITWLEDDLTATTLTVGDAEVQRVPQERLIGFVVEDVDKVVPELVINTAGGVPTAFSQTQMVPMLWGAVRALNARLDSLEKPV